MPHESPNITGPGALPAELRPHIEFSLEKLYYYSTVSSFVKKNMFAYTANM